MEKEMEITETTEINEVEELDQEELEQLEEETDEEIIEEEPVVEAVVEVKGLKEKEPTQKKENKGTLKFANAIKAYLDGRADGDELFAKTYAKENKNIEDCVTYILNEVKKSGSNGFMDQEIYGMAVHYYDEDVIEVGKKLDCQVITNQSQVFDEDEIAAIKEKAIEKIHDDTRREMTIKKTTPSKPKTDTIEQPSLF